MQLTSSKQRTVFGLAVSAAVLGALSMSAGTRTWSFDTDLSADPELIVLGNNDQPWQATTGNPGGFYAMNYGQAGQNSGILFPNIDPGMIVTGFLFECDARTGNGSTDRPADGFSISFARSGDPVLEGFANGSLGGFAGNGPAEFGSGTGIAISFDTWSGNALPDGADIEGIIVRVDNVTVLRQALPTRHGACDDITSLQTGPRNAAYWTGGGDARAPEAWAGLCWQPFSVQVSEDAKVTVKWKGTTILDQFQSSYFPSAGQLVFAGRTGDANMNAHIDNVKLTTTAASGGELPSVPANARTTQVGSRRVALAWDASTIPGGGQVAYEISRNGEVIAATVTATTYDDRGLSPNTAYTYAIRAKNVAGNLTDPANVNATTVADVDQLGVANYQIWANIPGTAVDAGLFDPIYSGPATRNNFANGLEVGTPPTYGGNPEGDNYLGVMKAVVTVPETGSYRFFIASDDASRLYIDGTPVPPDPLVAAYVAEETGCCTPFMELQDDGFGGVITPPETTEPIALTAGQKLGVTVVWKEGGGGDGVGVAWRLEGDTTPAPQLRVIGGGFISGNVDGVGSSVTFTEQPASQTVAANQAVILQAAATGVSPYNANISWHWYKNDQPLGARAGFNPFGRQLVIPFPSAADAGSYKVLAYVTGAAVFSEAATLTVNADTVAPTIVGINGTDSFDTATVTWSEPVTEASAETVGNYTFTGGLTVTGAELINSTQVRLTTSTQAEGASYTLTANGVRDTANNASAASAELKSFVFQTGSVTFSKWHNQTGGFNTWVDNGVQNLPPTTVDIRPSYNSALPNTSIENYFGQLKGVFIPPANGNYVFYVAGDDHTELYLSTDANPANKVKIAEEPAWSAAMKWNTDGADNSATRGEEGALANRSDQYPGTLWAGGPTITLTGGQRYYLEVLYKEGGGGDHGAATYTLAGAAVPANGSTALTGNVVGTFVDPSPTPPVVTDPPRIVSAPTHQFVAAGETATFSVNAVSVLPLSYQWFRNNKPLAGAEGSTLTIANAGVINIGDYRVQVSNANGTFTSNDNDSRLYLKGAFVVETEDYNFESGKTVPEASVMPLAANLYQGKDGVPDVDFHINGNSTGDPLANGNAYRNGWNNGGTAVEWPGFPDSAGNVDVIGDGGQGQRPDYNFTANYKTGWGDTGEWYQFTRDFEQGTYGAAFYGSRDGRGVDAMTKVLSIVTGDITQPNAAATDVGWAVHDQTGGWSSNDTIPFLKQGAPSGSTNPADLATFTLGPNTTVRLTLAVGDGDLDALYFYRLGGGGGGNPTLSAVRNADGSITLTFTGVLEVADNPAGPYVAQPAITSPYTFTPGAAAGAQFARSRN